MKIAIITIFAALFAVWLYGAFDMAKEELDYRRSKKNDKVVPDTVPDNPLTRVQSAEPLTQTRWQR